MGIMVRLFDLIVSGALLVLTAPVFLAVAILIKLDSPGPVFFLQERVGMGWRRFRMFKFRKMFHRVRGDGQGITARFDPRVTRVGSWLERVKLDELPQLLNVLLGDMSLVGPRPEIPRFVGAPHVALWDKVLSVRPGIFGPNQITHRNESELFPEDCEDVEAYYVERILPDKLRVDAGYAARKSVLYDAWIVLLGVWVSLTGVITRETVRVRRWQAAYLVGSVLLGELTLVVAFLLRFDWRIPAEEGKYLRHGLVLMAFARLAAFVAFKVQRSVHRYFSLSDALRICSSVAVGTVLGIAVQMLLNMRGLSRSVFIVDGVVLAVLMIALSHVVDRSLELLGREGARKSFSLLSYAVWSVGAGVAGVASMLYALGFVWPGVFCGRWFELSGILAAAFVVRAVLFPFLMRRLPGSDDFVTVVTRRMRLVAGHLVLVFVADITAGFFLNIRNFSRGAVIVSGLFYGLFTMLVLAVRCAWNRRRRVAGDFVGEAVAVGEKQRVLVVGDGRETGLLVSALKHAGNGSVEVVGVVTGKPENRTRRVEGVEVVGTTDGFSALLEAKEPSLVIVLKDAIERSALRRVLCACRERGVGLRLVPGMAELVGVVEEPVVGRGRGAEGAGLEASFVEVR